MHRFSVPWCEVYAPVFGLDQETQYKQRYLGFGRGVSEPDSKDGRTGYLGRKHQSEINSFLMLPWVTFSVLWRVRWFGANWQVPEFLKKSTPAAQIYAFPSILSDVWEHKPMADDDSAASFPQKCVSGHLIVPLYFYMAFKIIYSITFQYYRCEGANDETVKSQASVKYWSKWMAYD